MSNFKKLVEARMAATGDGWQKASAWVRAQRPTSGPQKQPAPERIPPHLTPQKYPVDERFAAILAVYGPADSRPDSSPPPRDVRKQDGSFSHAALAQYVHIEGTRFSNTTWHLSNEAEGAKVKTRVVLPEPITRQGIVNAFHQAFCPFLIETSADGGRTWTARFART